MNTRVRREIATAVPGMSEAGRPDLHPIELAPETTVELAFLKRLRDEVKFPNVDELKAQIGRDVQTALRYFKLHTRYAR